MNTTVSTLLASAWLLIAIQDSGVSQGADQDKSRFKNGAPEMYDVVFDRFSNNAEVSTMPMLWPYDTISLERTPCFGSCPIYKATLHRDGRIELHVTDNFSVPNGDWEGKIGTRMFGRLCYSLDSIKFQSLKSSYRAHWTDDTTCIVTASAGDKSKAVSDYGKVAPIGLWMFQESVDAIVKNVKWIAKK
jgi:uncharacterized protein DUF6438